eukprot:385347-Karenia_brevis.AAC.1
MLHYGLVNRLPHTSCYVDIPDHVQKLLDHTVLHTIHQISASQQQQYDQGQLHINTRKVTGHFAPKSARQIHLMTAALGTVRSSLDSVPLFPQTQPHPVPFSCPQGHKRSSTDFD